MSLTEWERCSSVGDQVIRFPTEKWPVATRFRTRQVFAEENNGGSEVCRRHCATTRGDASGVSTRRNQGALCDEIKTKVPEANDMFLVQLLRLGE